MKNEMTLNDIINDAKQTGRKRQRTQSDVSFQMSESVPPEPTTKYGQRKRGSDRR
jgi:hypothetical protein